MFIGLGVRGSRWAVGLDTGRRVDDDEDNTAVRPHQPPATSHCQLIMTISCDSWIQAAQPAPGWGRQLSVLRWSLAGTSDQWVSYLPPGCCLDTDCWRWLPLTLHSSYLGTYQPCSALLPRVLLRWCLSSQGARGALVTTRGQGYILQFGHTCNNNQASVTLNQLSFYFIQISLLFLNK